MNSNMQMSHDNFSLSGRGGDVLIQRALKVARLIIFCCAAEGMVMFVFYFGRRGVYLHFYASSTFFATPATLLFQIKMDSLSFYIARAVNMIIAKNLEYSRGGCYFGSLTVYA